MVFVPDGRKTRPHEAEISSDAALIRAAADGDGGAWAQIVTEHLPVVHRTAYRLVRDIQIAEDIAQESFLRLWKLANMWQPQGRISTWLCHVARNLAIDSIRRRSREVTIDVTDEIPDDGRTPYEFIAAKETQVQVNLALETLPSRQRDAIILVHFGNCSGSAAADIMGVSIEALESLLARARRSLRAILRVEREA